MCPTVSNLYHSNYNNNCSFDTLFILLFAIMLATVLFKRNFTQGWLNSYWLLPALPCLFYTYAFSLQNILKVEGSRAFSYLSVPHACCCWFIWKVFDVFVSVYATRSSMYTYTQPLVAFAFVVFALFISLILMAFVFVAFANCSRVKWY